MKKTLLLLFFIVVTSCYQETAIAIEGDFTTSYADEDESIPVIIRIENKITGADQYEWTFEGGNPMGYRMSKDITAMNIVRVLVGNGYILGSQYLGNKK